MAITKITDVGIVESMNDDANIYIEQDGEFSRLPLTALTEKMDDTFVGNTNAIQQKVVSYYIDGTNGSNDNPGTRALPFKDFEPVHEAMNQGCSNLRIGLFAGTYNFEAWAITNVTIHWYALTTSSTTLNFVPSDNAMPFYNCHMNFKGYETKDSNDNVTAINKLKIRCSKNYIYFDAGNVAFKNCNLVGMKLGLYHSGAEIIATDIDSVYAVGSTLHTLTGSTLVSGSTSTVTTSTVGAIEAISSNIYLERCTIYANRMTSHSKKSSGFIYLAGSVFSMSGAIYIDGSAGSSCANLFYALDSTLCFGSGVTLNSGFTAFKGNNTFESSVITGLQARFTRWGTCTASGNTISNCIASVT